MVRALDLSLEVQGSNPHGGSRPRGGDCHMETATWCDLMWPRGSLKIYFLNLKKKKIDQINKNSNKKINTFMLSIVHINMTKSTKNINTSVLDFCCFGKLFSSSGIFKCPNYY